MAQRINIGCGRTPSQGWINFDNSPALKLAKSPFFLRLVKFMGYLDNGQLENIEWNKRNQIRFADATKRIPLVNDSVECIYTSHMFEHLSRSGAKFFLKEAKRVLEVDGILRISVPDLRIAVDEYVRDGDADCFMEGILVQSPPFETARDKLRLILGGYRHHQWMYDANSLALLMEAEGFRNVTPCRGLETQIKNPEGLDLFERASSSAIVEGQK